MKYFLHQHPHNSAEEIDMRYREITRDNALTLYKERAGGGFGFLTAVQHFTKGVTYNQGYYTVWGEDINQKECFKRRLAGRLKDDMIK